MIALYFILHIENNGSFLQNPYYLSYWWNFGFLALFFSISQMLTGVFLAMFYVATPEMAFTLVYNLTNETFYGWWLRYIHAMVLLSPFL